MPNALPRGPMLLSIAFAFASSTAAPAYQELTNQTKIGEISFSLPDGLTISSVAGEPLIKWPIVADFDDQGRLVVAECGGVTAPIAEHNQLKLHKIIRLVDDDRDGVFDRRIVAADQLAFPEGVLCVGNDLFVAAPPLIWKFTDADDDGVCEHREVWFDPGTLTHCANDLHGPYMGPDGWIYWCKGAFAEQTHELADGRTIISSASHIYRRQISGGPIEMIIAGGMDNPVEVAFTPEGDMFFTSTFLHHPGNGLRDGIGHAVYGGLFGKDHRVLDHQIRTGSLLPVMTELGPAAPSGLACLRRNRILPHLSTAGETGHRTLVATQFNRQRVSVHHLVPSGATFQTADHDLVVADRVDFHPTDVLEDSDGSLVVLDTGGWYDLCCPSSRVNQKTASGGIYRIRRITESSTERAANDANGDANNDPGDRKLAELWKLCRVGGDEALAKVAASIESDDVSIATVAIRIASLHRWQHSLDSLYRRLVDTDIAIARVAAEALGRCGNADSARPLLQVMDREPRDRFLEHSAIYALVELQRRESSLNLISLAQTDSQLRAALRAVEGAGRRELLQPAILFAALGSSDVRLGDTATELLAERNDLASTSILELEDLFGHLDANSLAAPSLRRLVAAWKYEPEVQAMVGRWLETTNSLTSAQETFLATNLAAWSPAKLPASWLTSIATWLDSAAPDVRASLIASLTRLSIDDAEANPLTQTILRLAQAERRPLDQLAILAALPDGSHIDDVEIRTAIVVGVSSDDDVVAAESANVLRRIVLDAEAAQELIGRLTSISASHLPLSIEAIKRCGDDEVGARMLQRLPSVPAARTLNPDFLPRLYAKSPPVIRRQADVTNRHLTQASTDISKAVTQKLKTLQTGDPIRGLQVFHGKKAACGSCHQIGYVGGSVGPELTRIGSSRTAESLVEAILFPNSRIETSFRSTQILTIDGRIFRGLVKRQDSQVVELQVAADRVESIRVSEIDQTEPSEISVMPSGLDQLLTDQEFADLIALLQAAK